MKRHEMTPPKQIETRKAEEIIEIDAPVEAVWKALTQAKDLTNWFPLKVEKTEQGNVKLIWQDSLYFNLQVTQFKLNKHVKLEERPLESEIPDEMFNEKVLDELEKSATLSIDIELEGKKGGTVLRLIHSGFGKEQHWDDIYHSVRRGWAFELRGLRHYLENHNGTKRSVVWIKQDHALSLHDSWKKIMNIFSEDIEGLHEHDKYTLNAKTGDYFEGMVQVNDSPYVFSGTIANLNNSVLRIFNESSGDKVNSNFWISAYDVPQKKLNDLKQKWENAFAAACL